MSDLSDNYLDSQAAEDEPWLLAWDLADRLQKRAEKRDFDLTYFGQKAVSELAVRCVQNNPRSAKRMADQLESMAAYIRQHLVT